MIFYIYSQAFSNRTRAHTRVTAHLLPLTCDFYNLFSRLRESTGDRCPSTPPSSEVTPPQSLFSLFLFSFFFYTDTRCAHNTKRDATGRKYSEIDGWVIGLCLACRRASFLRRLSRNDGCTNRVEIQII